MAMRRQARAMGWGSLMLKMDKEVGASSSYPTRRLPTSTVAVASMPSVAGCSRNVGI